MRQFEESIARCVCETSYAYGNDHGSRFAPALAQAEAALQIEHEILITRDSQPVAKLVRIPAEASQQPQFRSF